jgi:hypothetical protein
MWTRNHKGDITTFDPSKFPSEYQMYTALWRIKYNMDLGSKTPSFNDKLISFMNTTMERPPRGGPSRGVRRRK